MNALPKCKEENVSFMVYNTFGSTQMKTGGHVNCQHSSLLTHPFARLAQQQKLGKEFKKEALVPKRRLFMVLLIWDLFSLSFWELALNSPKGFYIKAVLKMMFERSGIRVADGNV